MSKEPGSAPGDLAGLEQTVAAMVRSISSWTVSPGSVQITKIPASLEAVCEKALCTALSTGQIVRADERKPGWGNAVGGYAAMLRSSEAEVERLRAIEQAARRLLLARYGGRVHTPSLEFSTAREALRAALGEQHV